MKYTFSFKEINRGSIEIESDHMPDYDEVVDAIMSGNAYYKDTDYTDVKLVEELAKSKKPRNYER
jgi:hypothetical protein